MSYSGRIPNRSGVQRGLLEGVWGTAQTESTSTDPGKVLGKGGRAGLAEAGGGNQEFTPEDGAWRWDLGAFQAPTPVSPPPLPGADLTFLPLPPVPSTVPSWCWTCPQASWACGLCTPCPSPNAPKPPPPGSTPCPGTGTASSPPSSPALIFSSAALSAAQIPPLDHVVHGSQAWNPAGAQ